VIAVIVVVTIFVFVLALLLLIISAFLDLPPCPNAHSAPRQRKSAVLARDDNWTAHAHPSEHEAIALTPLGLTS
jgi:hypothetical protein